MTLKQELCRACGCEDNNCCDNCSILDVVENRISNMRDSIIQDIKAMTLERDLIRIIESHETNAKN